MLSYANRESFKVNILDIYFVQEVPKHILISYEVGIQEIRLY